LGTENISTIEEEEEEEEEGRVVATNTIVKSSINDG
jgi:hypothetical protein